MTLQQSTLALVTGAASGIGKATALRLLEQKARVLALDRCQESLDALMSETQSHGIILCCFDLQKIEAIPKLISDLTESHGPITQLVNNAGVWDGGPITEMSDQVWRLNFDVNVGAPFALIRELAPGMLKAGGGAIVNVSSRNAYRSSTNNAAYDASKAALVALTRTAAGEFACNNIRGNAVCPGVIDTPGDLSIQEMLFKKVYLKQIPMDRYGRPGEIASVITFLLSQDASFLNGQAIIVDGGQIACQDNKRLMEITTLNTTTETSVPDQRIVTDRE